MPKFTRLASALLVAAVVAESGCGSTSTTSTKTTSSPNANANALATGSSQTTIPSAGTEAQHTTSAGEPKPAEANPKQQEKAAEANGKSGATGSKRSAQTAKPSTGVVKVQVVPVSRQYPKQLRAYLLAYCTSTHKVSTSSCECLMAKFELSSVGKEQSGAELLATQVALVHHLAMPRRSQRWAEECKAV